MRPSRVQRGLLGAFPPSFRSRYGEELEAAAVDSGRGWRDSADLLRAAASAWIRPCFAGPAEERRRQRLQATTATVFVSWSLSALAVAVFAKAVDDQPVPGLKSWGWWAYLVGSGLFQITVAAALVVGFGYWLGVVAGAWRSGDRRTVVASALPGAVVLVWLAGTGLVALYARHYVAQHSGYQTWRLPGHGTGIILGLYGLFTLASVAVCAASAVRGLVRARLGTPYLLLAARLSGLAMVSLLVVTGAAVCLSRVLAVGGIDTRTAVMAIAPVVFCAGASAVALTSSVRGLSAWSDPVEA
jgi:hypothetical protein